MKPQSAKAKGRRFQQQIRDLLLEHAGDRLEADDVRSTSMGASGEDLLLSPAARSIYPIAAEVKNQERLNIWKSLEQAESHAESHVTPVLFFKRNRSEAYAALPAAELARLYAALNDAREKAWKYEELSG